MREYAYRLARKVPIFGDTLRRSKHSIKVNGIVSVSCTVMGLPLPYAWQLRVSCRQVHITLTLVYAFLANYLTIKKYERIQVLQPDSQTKVYYMEH